ETECVTFGLNDNGDFAIHQANKRVGGAHIAFPASNREHVERFWGAALAAGATPVRAPGTHPDYGRGSFAAFVRDRDGNNIEAVYRAPIQPISASYPSRLDSRKNSRHRCASA